MLFLVVALLAGCGAGKEYVYEPANESPPGPGLLSGDDGVFTLYEKTGKPQKQDEEKPEADGADVNKPQ